VPWLPSISSVASCRGVYAWLTEARDIQGRFRRVISAPRWLWVAVVVAYGGFWFALSMLVASIGLRSAANATVLASAWLVLVVMLPSVFNLVATSVFPVPSRMELVQAVRVASDDANAAGTASERAASAPLVGAILACVLVEEGAEVLVEYLVGVLLAFLQRHAGGEPDPLLGVLSRAPAILPREPRRVLLWQRRPFRAVLLASYRSGRGGRTDSHPCRCPADRAVREACIRALAASQGGKKATCPPGRYDELRQSLILQSDPSSRVSARLEAAIGGYFDGQLQTSRLVLQATPDPRVAINADYTVNRLSQVGRAASPLTTHLLGVELRLAASPRLQFVSFVQWNTVARQTTANARLVWDYRPLSFFTVVYNDRGAADGRGVSAPAPTSVRQLLMKLTWLWQL